MTTAGGTGDSTLRLRWVTVASDVEEKVPTGGELTLFEAVGLVASLPSAPKQRS
jgi:hypothetical protein